MVIVMDMSTGKKEKPSAEEAAVEAFGAFVDEVLNAGWLPQPEARLETVSTDHTSNSALLEPDEFLRNLYRHQE